MIKCEELYRVFKKNGFEFFTGVPDSTFKPWMSFLDDMHGKNLTNRIAAIERDAVAWAAGYNAATGKIGVVYMQNSGEGNIVNPKTSLADPYNFPILLMIGWRGEPGEKDEPQHFTMGEITLQLLDTLGIKYSIMPDNVNELGEIISNAKEYITQNNRIYALVIKKGTFEPYEKKKVKEQGCEMLREEAIKAIVDVMDGTEAIISTTGKTSRELFELREATNFGHQNDFLMVGSMGAAAPMGAEIALQKPEKKVFIFDGDSAVIMSMGSMSTIGYYSPKNFYHVVFENECHDSTGGQPNTSTATDFEKLALANSYKGAKTVETKEELQKAIKEIRELEGPQMLIVKVRKGARKDLGRPTTTPPEDKKAFMEFLKK